MLSQQIKHIYQNHHLDSTIWDHYDPRPNDIIISSGFKSGTTWMQMIIAYLIFQKVDLEWPLQDLSPWIELTWNPEKTINLIENQKHRRFLKTHLSLDGIFYYPEAKYIVLSRDPRDIFMSLWNHYQNYTDLIYERFKTLPCCPEDIHVFWENWISRGWFEWEKEGYPFWGVMNHLRTWWEFRHLQNIIFIHYNDLLLNLKDQIIKIADFLNISLSENLLEFVFENVQFDKMKKNANRIWKDPSKTWKGGGETFFYQGVNGRWKAVLSENELKQYESTASLVFQDDCRLWVERILPSLRQ